MKRNAYMEQLRKQAVEALFAYYGTDEEYAAASPAALEMLARLGLPARKGGR